MYKSTAKRLVLFIFFMMSLNVLLTDTFPIVNKILAIVGLFLFVFTYQKSDETVPHKALME